MPIQKKNTSSFIMFSQKKGQNSDRILYVDREKSRQGGAFDEKASERFPLCDSLLPIHFELPIIIACIEIEIGETCVVWKIRHGYITKIGDEKVWKKCALILPSYRRMQQI